jgi:hypothetical protein
MVQALSDSSKNLPPRVIAMPLRALCTRNIALVGMDYALWHMVADHKVA